MQDFLNNPVAMGMLLFGICLIVGSAAMRWIGTSKEGITRIEQSATKPTVESQEELEQIKLAIEAGKPFNILVNGKPHSVLAVRFGPRDTMPERIQAVADEWSINPEDVGYRALTQHLGQYALKPIPADFEVKSVDELLVAGGLQKPRNTALH